MTLSCVFSLHDFSGKKHGKIQKEKFIVQSIFGLPRVSHVVYEIVVYWLSH